MKGPIRPEPEEPADGQIYLNIFDSIYHLRRLVDFPDENQAKDDFADAPRVLLAIGNPGMRHASGIDSEEIPVLGEDDPSLGQGISCLLLVDGTKQPLVQFSSRWKRIVLGIGLPCLESLSEP